MLAAEENYPMFVWEAGVNVLGGVWEMVSAALAPKSLGVITMSCSSKRSLGFTNFQNMCSHNVT